MELQITYRHFPTSDALSAHIRALAENLERLASDLRSCRVVVDEPHQRHGKPFQVRVVLEVEGEELVAEESNLDAYAAVSEAFRAAERQVQSHAQRRRHEVKRHGTR